MLKQFEFIKKIEKAVKKLKDLEFSEKIFYFGVTAENEIQITKE